LFQQFFHSKLKHFKNWKFRLRPHSYLIEGVLVIEENNIRTKCSSKKNTLSTSERSDEKGLCVPKRLYFPQTIFTLKREESEKAKKKAEMRLIWWCYISCFNSPNQAPTLTPHYFSHHIKLLKNKNTVELSAQKWFQSSNFPPLLTLVSILNYTGNQRKKNRDRQKLVSKILVNKTVLTKYWYSDLYKSKIAKKATIALKGEAFLLYGSCGHDIWWEVTQWVYLSLRKQSEWYLQFSWKYLCKHIGHFSHF